ncbi:MAG: AMP-binding protein [Oscillospiraceae bacterium]
MDIPSYHLNFVKEGYDENGILNKFELTYPENFNFSYDIIDKYAEIEPDRRALMWVDLEGNERLFTFGDLSRLSTKAANMFLAMGIKKGDHVMLVLKRNYQFWYVIMALIKIGAIAIPATHLLTTKDFVYRFEAADVKAVIATSHADVSHYVEEADEKLGGCLNAKYIVNGTRDGWTDFDKEIEKYPDTMERVPTSADETFLLYFTSGTTGYPKMVIHDHTYALAHIQTAKHWHNVDPNGIHLTISDTGWGKAAWGKLYGQLAMGTCVFVYDFDKFIPENMLAIMEKYKITTFCAPPTMFRFFIKAGIGDYDLSSLKYCTIAGEALNPEVYNKWYEFTGIKLMEGFGQTESTLMLANTIGMEPKPGSMGKPTPLYDIVLVDADGQEVPVGETGEICVRGEYTRTVGLFRGYYRNKEITDEAWRDGLYHTGDTAWRDEDGYYWYVGRNDDVIKASGYRIGPFEIESVLIAHPAVLECAVTGAPHPIRGMVVKATVVLAKGYTASDELVKELQDHVKKNTAPYKYPRIVEFVDELPKTISGKIKRTEIRKRDQEKYDAENPL